jgi:hypothetical protein
MADNVIEASAQTQDSSIDTKALLAEQMAISLNGGSPPAKTEDATPPATDQASAGATVQVTPFDAIREKFSYQTAEDAIREIEELRAMKASPVTPEIAFENEESEKLFKAWTAGKKDEVFSYLERQRELERASATEVNKDTASGIVKMAMQLRYKDLTPEEVAYKFNKQFGMPAKPTQGADEDEVDYQQRVSSWQDIVNDRQMELMIEAKLAKPELEATRTKLVLPELEADGDGDEGYKAYKKMLADQEKVSAQVQEAYKVFTPKHIETKIDFKDEANKVGFTFQYEPDAESFASAKEMATDITKFFDSFKDQAGNPDRQKFLSAMYFAFNKEKVIMEAMKQAEHATIKSMLPDNSQGAGLQRHTTQEPELSELDKQMRMSLNGFMK